MVRELSLLPSIFFFFLELYWEMFSFEECHFSESVAFNILALVHFRISMYLVHKIKLILKVKDGETLEIYEFKNPKFQ